VAEKVLDQKRHAAERTACPASARRGRRCDRDRSRRPR
jgi:hypothetical protein